MENTPVNAAHAFANAAEELGEKEQWGKAMEAHFRAAEQFALAMNYTSDPEAIRTLRLLYTNHTRQGKEIQRRVAKQAQQSPKPQEQLNPQSSHRTRRTSSSTSSKSNASNSQAKNNSERIQPNQSKQSSTLSTQQTTRPNSQVTPNSCERLSSDNLRTGNNDTLGINSLTSSRRNPVLSDSATSMGVSRTNTMTSSTTQSMMDGSSDSEKTIEESYMMLKGNNDSTDDDDSDPFNKFWDIVEGLVQKISNPVAFATVPLNGADSQTKFDPNTIQSPLPFRYNTANENIVDDSKVEELNAAMMESFYIIPKDQRPNSGSRTLGLPQSSSASSASTPKTPLGSLSSNTKSLEEYSIENKQLKAIIDNMSKRMLTYEKAAEENNMLKSSILQFKNDVQKQAKRIKASQEILRSSSIVKQPSPESSTVGNAYLQRRIKELEEENRLLRSERDKQQELVAKYKDRWEKLKESAKKKRVNKQAEASPLSQNENSSSTKSNSENIQQSEHQNNTSPTSSTFSKQSQLVLPISPTTNTTTTTVNEVSAQSPSSSGTILPFALQKPQQRPGVGGILDVSSNSKNNNVFSTPQRHSAPPTTTILHATSTGPNKLNADRMNFSGSSDNIEVPQLAFLPHPQQQNREISAESTIPPISSVNNPLLSARRESAPAINSSSNSITASSMFGWALK
ncbi:hypothetical protein RhiirA1_455743 [Rhizophagus irregularis]|uniref:Uncharacterized protein n=3 Tax=Rhizophagus irregularis TaxID=588596 RepID=A0A2I1E7N1_9GLOM|nr:hypothetical protein GLOIN_2v1774641 [Rhizophagus irregularis DAOM 181602=DAOM 197198]EXX66470.1 hypothetical protein RirG_123490 [Rhizophagus irregularis DAOM 197198w]PKC69671.1 hypothetical protein RhiirA1_455743 [Rhizophagus irregularis]PKY18138.1 hypothetical protein RhiirB3_430882 [Rhizophagus irregularis]POG71602.1 hypothetical protein GLOIN_2v1774641 [Rhizophagus irregularis DAOM 181602=DAOM 197198]UZO26118.1 hypothetical protein OCT59_018364 [Rhizophagus irregularis]|eukprot:XP_025178468.1 hypothetical protein GLOIN_2v1774641 [Rhizophagus irregularis DAOM 181602=DAOM 197198]